MKCSDRAFRVAIVLPALLWLVSVAIAGPDDVRFRRGDVNGDAKLDIADPAFLLEILLTDSAEIPTCYDAADANDDGAIDISDSIRLLVLLFFGDTMLPPPGGEVCGIDPTMDDLGCDLYLPCALSFGEMVEIASPSRAAVLSGSAEVAVRGTVLAPDRLVELRVNGAPVPVKPDCTFELLLSPRHGVNVLRYEITTIADRTVTSVRTFLWSEEYRPRSDVPQEIAIHRGGSLFLRSDVIDDQVRDNPPDDLAHVAEVALVDFSPSLPATLFSRGNSNCRCSVFPLRVCSWVRVTGSNLTFRRPSVRLTPLTGGRLRAVVTLADPQIDLRATGEVVCVDAGPFTGSARATEVVATATLAVEARGGAPEVTVTSLSTDLRGARVTINLGPLTDIASDIASSVLGIFERDLENQLTRAVARELPHAIAESLMSISFSTELHVPPPLEATVTFGSGLESIGVESAGITLHYDTSLTSDTRIAVERGSIVSPLNERTPIPTDRPAAIALAHDMLNQLLYAAWKSSRPTDLSTGLPATELFVVERFTAVPLLPFVLVPADDALSPLRLETGDIEFTASLAVFGGSTIELDGFLSGAVPARIVPRDDHLEVEIEDVSSIAIEVTSVSTGDDLSETAAALELLLPTVFENLGGGVLGEVALPTLPILGVEWRASDLEVVYGDAHVYLKGSFGP